MITYYYETTAAQGTPLDDHLSRVTRVKDGSVTLAKYDYNGIARVVGIDYAEASVMWKQYGSTEGDYPDLDRFNRVTSSRWTKDLATDKDFVDLDVTHDRNSNITLIEDNVHTGFDVDYTIDDLNRLTDAQEGTWSGGSISSETRQQIWTLDQPGNWDHVKLDLDGDNAYTGADEYDDDRTHNVVNELTARDTDDNGTDNHTLTYDAVGNLTDDNEDYKYEYDTFSRLRKIKSQAPGNPLVAEYKYGSLGHRIAIHFDVDGDGTVENTSDDPWYWLAYDEGWRLLALFEDTDSAPTEEWVPHHAGLSGFGGSSYIDDVVLRDRDTDDDGSFDERIYYGQNWRHDVVAIVTDTGKMLEWGKFTSYGVADGAPAGDTNSDGDWDSTDQGNITGAYDVRKDANLDGSVSISDITHANSITGSYQTLGWEVLSSTGVENRKGYAGYELAHSNAWLYHVRNRVLNNKLGRWTRRDPLGYVDGANLYAYARSNAIRWLDSDGLWVTAATCNQLMMQCLTTDPNIAAVVAAILACGGNFPRIRCVPCPPGNCPPGNYACYQTVTNQLDICTCATNSPQATPAFMCQILLHELIHAYDRQCLFPLPGVTTRCEQSVCTEIRAYHCSGRCAGSPNYWACLRNAVWQSSRRACSNSRLEFNRAYNAVFPLCLGCPPGVIPPPTPPPPAYIPYPPPRAGVNPQAVPQGNCVDGSVPCFPDV